MPSPPPGWNRPRRTGKTPPARRPAAAARPPPSEPTRTGPPPVWRRRPPHGRVPEGEGELAADVLEHALAVLLPQVRQQFGVGVGAEVVALGLQGRLHLGVVEQFAVEDDPDRLVFVGDRLPAVAEADDAQP